MKSINLLSLSQAHDSISSDQFLDLKRYYNIEIKNAEIEEVKALLESLRALITNPCLFDGFLVGYKIPQIGKEFDLLKVNRDAVINIELKRTSTPEKIKKQLIRNRYYLSFIGKEIYAITFSSDTGHLYALNQDDELVGISSLQLCDLLEKYGTELKENIDSLFNPSDYLVSPFNSTEKFLSDKYFLTHQQEDFKSQITKLIFNATNSCFISVVGAAGTGKTLLVYDIAKLLSEAGKNVLLVHCGQLNSGHLTMIGRGWEIIEVKNLASHDLSKHNTIIIDEVQRIYAHQLDDLITKVTTNKQSCIFSYDRLQTLATWEKGNDEKIEKINNLHSFELSEKIRTNKEIASFIKMLFNNNRKVDFRNAGNIELNYFKNLDDAKKYLLFLDREEWEILRFTPSRHNKEYHQQYSSYYHQSAHRVIGQEFDNVVVTIDRHFEYHVNGNLIYSGYGYYNALKMLFQNITRTRKKLKLIIIDNEALLKKCISILS